MGIINLGISFFFFYYYFHILLYHIIFTFIYFICILNILIYYLSCCLMYRTIYYYNPFEEYRPYIYIFIDPFLRVILSILHKAFSNYLSIVKREKDLDSIFNPKFHFLIRVHRSIASEKMRKCY